MENQGKQWVIFMRHGEKGQRSEEQFEKQRIIKEYDSHLTRLGQLQSKLAGQKILEFIQKQNPQIKKLQIVSSPFLRCIMTAESTMQSMQGIIDIKDNQINTHNGISESLTENLIQFCPFEQGLVIREQNWENLKTDFIKNKINDQYPDQFQPKYPEGPKTPSSYNRSFQNFKIICADYFSQKPDQNTALLIVAHGATVKAILNNMKIRDAKDTQSRLTNFNILEFTNENQKQFQEIPNIITLLQDSQVEEAQKMYNQEKLQ